MTGLKASDLNIDWDQVVRIWLINECDRPAVAHILSMAEADIVQFASCVEFADGSMLLTTIAAADLDDRLTSTGPWENATAEAGDCGVDTDVGGHRSRPPVLIALAAELSNNLKLVLGFHFRKPCQSLARH